MSNPHNGNSHDNVTRDSILKKLADLYDRTSIAYVLRILQPVSIFLTAIGLVFAAWAVKLSIQAMELSTQEIAESRNVREATLFVMLTERLDIARKRDSDKSATYEFDKEKEKKRWRCSGGSRQLRADVGQIQVLERMNSMGMSLRDIKAHDVNLVVRRRRKPRLPGIELQNAKLFDADLRNSNLRHADLGGAQLVDADLQKTCLEDALLPDANLTRADAIHADFSGADLTNAKLNDSRLTYARFKRTDFSGADLTNADITGADLYGAKNLEQPQLDKACANSKKQRPAVPRKLTWKERECP